MQRGGQAAAGDVGEHGVRGGSAAEPPSLGAPTPHPASRTVVVGVGGPALACARDPFAFD